MPLVVADRVRNITPVSISPGNGPSGLRYHPPSNTAEKNSLMKPGADLCDLGDASSSMHACWAGKPLGTPASSF